MAKKVLNTRHQQKSDTTENWSSQNPVLMRSEIGFEFCANGTIKMKIGNGSLGWNSLPYFNPIQYVLWITFGLVLKGENFSVTGNSFSYNGTIPSTLSVGVLVPSGNATYTIKCGERTKDITIADYPGVYNVQFIPMTIADIIGV